MTSPAQQEPDHLPNNRAHQRNTASAHRVQGRHVAKPLASRAAHQHPPSSVRQPVFDRTIAPFRGSDPDTFMMRSPVSFQRQLKQVGSKCAVVLIDVVLVVCALILAYWMRYRVNWPAPLNQIIRDVLEPNNVPLTAFQPFALPLLALLLASFAIKGLYRLPRAAGVFDHAAIIVGGTTTAMAILIVLVFVFRPTQFYSRLIFAFAWLAIVALLCVWRVLVINVRRWRWTRGLGRERVLVVGGTGLGRAIMEELVAQPFLGYQLVGYLDDRPPPPTERRDGHFRHLGAIHELATLARVYNVNQVILALPFWEHSRLPDLVQACRQIAIEFRLAPDLYELSFDRVHVGKLGTVPLIGLKDVSLKGVNLVIKRTIDVLFTLLIAPFVLPVFGVIMLAIQRDSPGSAIFKQQRIGKNGQPFTVYKFRTMVADAEARKAELEALNEADGPIFKIRNDPRMTRVGRWLRRTSLDELPQLWNIVRGEMSWVGPRPPTPDEVAHYNEWHKRRLEVTPGLTGLWQVLGRSDTSFDEMVRLDIYYAENWSPVMDLRLMLQTIPVVLSSKGAY